ncbi:MAG: PIG-L family deacetylase [Dyella sp.]
MDAVTPPQIEGRGHPESAWQGSRWLADLPTQPYGKLLNGTRRLVIISPHPDDEVLGCGGLIHHARQAGLQVCLLSVTRGEACYPGHLRWTRDRLGTMRGEELLRAVAELGVAPAAVCPLGFPDGGVADHESSLIDAISTHLAWGDHVFCTAAWDGHPDHEATGRAACAAAGVKGLRVSQFPIWAWHWSDPDHPDPPAPGGARYTLDPTAWRAKQRAMDCFTSQTIGPGDRPPILPAHVMERFARHEETFFHGNV